jgi:hypothetical protein
MIYISILKYPHPKQYDVQIHHPVFQISLFFLSKGTTKRTPQHPMHFNIFLQRHALSDFQSSYPKITTSACPGSSFGVETKFLQ